MGLYAEWQPIYEAHGVAIFPVRPDKTPAVKGYLRIGSRVSRQLVPKFTETDAFGLACKPNRITVLDVDTTDERILADGLDRHGQTPFIVRSGSGNFQAWYRHNGERRHVRPDPALPIDILGDGYVVCPPSLSAKGRYEIIQGTLDDLDNLPTMRGIPQSPPVLNDDRRAAKSSIREGNRNQSLWVHLMKAVRVHNTLEQLHEIAMKFNEQECYEPLPDAEVIKVIAQVLRYESEGKNWFGHGSRVVFAVDEVDDLVADPRAFTLFAILRRHHSGSNEFVLAAPAMATSLGWSQNTLRAARDVLVKHGLIKCIHRGGNGPNDPPRFRFA